LVAKGEPGSPPGVGGDTKPEVVTGLDQNLDQRIADGPAQIVDGALAQGVAGELGNGGLRR